MPLIKYTSQATVLLMQLIAKLKMSISDSKQAKNWHRFTKHSVLAAN